MLGMSRVWSIYVTGDPVRSNDFEAAVTFLKYQLTAQQTKNGSEDASRKISAMDSDAESSGEEETEDDQTDEEEE